MRLRFACAVLVSFGAWAALKLRSEKPTPVVAVPAPVPAPAPPPVPVAAPAPVPAPAPPPEPVAAPPPVPEVADAEVDELIATRKYREAERILARAIAAAPRDGDLRLKRADLYFRQSQRKKTLAEWDAALRLKPDLRNEPRLQQQMCVALDPRTGAGPQRLLVRHFGTGATPVMHDCIKRAPTRAVVRAAVHVIEAVSGPAKVDAGLVARRELELAQTCEERKRAVEALGALQSHQAIAALTALERQRTAQRVPAAPYACLGRSVQQALPMFGLE